MAAGIWPASRVQAAAVTSETFSGGSTALNQWTSGGGDSDVACLTASSESLAGSIPACDEESPLDDPGEGVLRLTPAVDSKSGFAIYNTPISAEAGLDFRFDMYQYGGDGADGIAFFLVDGEESPTQPGALGGSLGYSSNNDPDPGIVGGYVGIGFDRFGNFSNPAFGNGGPGPNSNNITVRGNEASNYQFVTTKNAFGQLGNESASDRQDAVRHVRVTISTNNIMNIYVDYDDGEGYRTELQNIDLTTINGEGSLPETFKFGFTAGTGGQNNIHEISGLEVNTLGPNVGVDAGSVDVTAGEYAEYEIEVSNDSGAQDTVGDITITDTLPPEFTPLEASGDGWDCVIDGQEVTCNRPADGADVLEPGASAPAITVKVLVAKDVNLLATYQHELTIGTDENTNLDPTGTGDFTVVSEGDLDGIFLEEEDAAPNGGDANDDGDQDSEQAAVTSFENSITGKYAVLESAGDCEQNQDVSIAAESTAHVDGGFSYPAGLMSFKLVCDAPGDSTVVTQYYYGYAAGYDVSKLVLRKFNTVNNTYQTIDSAVLSIVTIGGETALKAVYTLTDGGALDQDGAANGTIVDPAGPALRVASVTAPTGRGAGAPDTGLQASESAGLYYVLAGAGALLVARAIGYRKLAHAVKTLVPRPKR